MNPLRILVVTHDYPPPVAGGYGVMAADVCQMLVARGHDVDVLAAADTTQRQSGESGPRVYRVLRTYYENGECTFPALEASADIERHNLSELDRRLRDRRPDVVSFWHMGALSLNMIAAAADRGFPLLFVIGDDWLVYGAWADGWQRRFLPDYEPDRAEQVARETGLLTKPPDVWRLGHLCFVSEYTRSRAIASGNGARGSSSVVQPGLPDSFALAAQIRRLAADAELRKRLGAAALATSQHFRLARQVDELELRARQQAGWTRNGPFSHPDE